MQSGVAFVASVAWRWALTETSNGAGGPIQMTFKGYLRAGCAVAACFAGTGIAAANENYCTYRDGRPVWHFMPAEAIPNDFLDAAKLSDGYLTQRGGRGFQENVYTDECINELVEVYKKKFSLDSDDTQLLRADIEQFNGTPDMRFVFEGIPKPNACENANVSNIEDVFKERADSQKFKDLSAQDRLTWIENIGRELTEFDQTEGDEAGDSDVAQIPYGAPLNPEWHYMRFTLVQANLSFSRRFWKVFYPAVHTNISFSSVDGPIDASGITTDKSHYALDRRRVSRTLVRNQVILPATPYVGGDVNLDVAVIGVQSFDYATQFLEFLDSVTNDIGAKLLSEVTPIYKIINNGIEYMSRTKKETQFLISGVALDLDKPRTGYWLLLWPSKDFVKAYADTEHCRTDTPETYRPPLATLVQNKPGGGAPFSINDGIKLVRTSEGGGTDSLTLLVRQNDEEGDRQISERTGLPTGQWEPLDNASWALVRVDALRTNPNWRRIAGAANARRKIIETMANMYFPNFFSGKGSNATTNNNTPDDATTPSNGTRTLEDKLEADIQFYMTLLLSTPDLLEFDKYQIVQRELISMKRHRHIFETVGQRGDLIADAYEKYRKWDEFRLKCQFQNYFGDAAPEGFDCKTKKKASSPAPADPPPEPEAAPTTPVDESEMTQEPEATPTAPEDVDEVTPESVAFTPPNLKESGDKLTNLLDAFMASHPAEAVVLGYNGPSTLDEQILMHAAAHPDGAVIRSQLIDFVADSMMFDWYETPGFDGSYLSELRTNRSTASPK